MIYCPSEIENWFSIHLWLFWRSLSLLSTISNHFAEDCLHKKDGLQWDSQTGALFFPKDEFTIPKPPHRQLINAVCPYGQSSHRSNKHSVIDICTQGHITAHVHVWDFSFCFFFFLFPATICPHNGLQGYKVHLILKEIYPTKGKRAFYHPDK